MFSSILIAIAVAGAGERPLLVGGHAHGADNVRALVDLGLGNFVWIPKLKYGMGNTPWDLDPEGPNGIYADVDACVRNGMYFAVSQRRGLGEMWRPGGPEYGGDCWGGDLHDAEVVREIARRGGSLFAGLHAEELDADFVQSGLRPGSRSRTPHLYDFTDRAGGRHAFESELARIRDKYRDYGPGVEFWPNLCVSYHLSGFRTGADLVFAELLESLPTTELQLAFLRGGARQFGSDWGVWVSPWFRGEVPTEDKALWPARQAAVGGGHTPSAFRRCLYLSYASGARVLTVQETEPLFSYRDPEDPGAGYTLAAWGDELKGFWEYVRQHTQIPEPVVNLAVMVDKDSGWAPGNLHGGWIDKDYIWAKLPTDRSDKMLTSYLDVLIPGYGRGNPDAWKSREHTYPGYFSSTPSGAFDIVASDATADRLAGYASVVLLGDIQMTGDLLRNLRAYVHGGGSLLVNAYQMRHREAYVQDEELLGATVGMRIIPSSWAGGDIIGRQLISAQHIHPRAQLAGVRDEPYEEPWFAMQDVQPGNAEVLADDGAGSPVLLRNRFGDGYAYLSTPEYMLQGWEDQNKVLSFFAEFLRGMARTGPVTVTAPESERSQEGISWVASRRGNRVLLIVLANHAKEERAVDVRCHMASRKARVESGGGWLLNEHTDSAGDVLRLSIPPEDIAVLALEMSG